MRSPAKWAIMHGVGRAEDVDDLIRACEDFDRVLGTYKIAFTSAIPRLCDFIDLTHASVLDLRVQAERERRRIVRGVM